MKAAIVGAGVIGGGWAARFLLHGWTVAVFDPSATARAALEATLAAARRSLPKLYDASLPDEGRLIWAPDLETAIADADWIQESVSEDLDLKRRVHAAVAGSSRPDVPIASSTSGFRPSVLAAYSAHGDRLLVCHPFNPVYLLPLVEVVPSERTSLVIVDQAMAVLEALGMKPVRIRREIDAHVADRLLEAMWREALWLVRDGIATTEEIDTVIRCGFGPRWAQMGMFETYRVAGGEAGMRHFLAQFGPALKWPWSRLTDVPELTGELIEKIAQQSDEQAQGASIRELERRRDDNLVAMFRALKARDQGVGAVLNTAEAHLRGLE